MPKPNEVEPIKTECHLCGEDGPRSLLEWTEIAIAAVIALGIIAAFIFLKWG